MENKNQFGNLSEFKGRDVELYMSVDLHNTAIYFTDVEHDKRDKAEAFFQLLRFGLEGGDHQIYIRFPNTDYFVEMHNGGFGSGRGSMTVASGKNVHGTEYKKSFTIHSHDRFLMLSIGDKDLLPEFNFMTKVASYDKGNPFCHPYPNETSLNISELEKVLELKYLKIPENIRKIQYCFKTTDENPEYFLVDFPLYNLRYSNHRFFAIQNNVSIEYKIKDFQRFRDGGTTIMTVIDDKGIEHKFFTPQRMNKNSLCEKWDETELVPVSDEEQEMLVKLLGLELEPKSSVEDEYLSHKLKK